jgi:MoxR-like ATPase
MRGAEEISLAFARHGYVANEQFAVAMELVMALEKPLLIEGPAGVGKTESAKVLADVLGTTLIRLQCYEGLDSATALYEWNYPRQLLRIRLTENGDGTISERETEIFSEEFLLKRPLLAAITAERRPVLLIDEVDRADEAFEAFLLELLGEFQVTIPELGTIAARHRPYVIVTSNRSRELSDALRRRCLYLWLDFPGIERETEILRARVPGIGERLANEIARVMAFLRTLQLNKAPGVAESIDWALALVGMHRDALGPEVVEQTMSCILKAHEDWQTVRAERDRLAAVLADGAAPSYETDYGVGTVIRRSL